MKIQWAKSELSKNISKIKKKPDQWIADPDFRASSRVIHINLIVIDSNTEVVRVEDSEDC